MMRQFYSHSLRNGEHRPTSLLVLSALLVLFVPFDNLVQLGSFYLARNLSAVIGLILIFLFAIMRLKFFRLHQGPPFWGLAFLVCALVTTLLLWEVTGELEIDIFMQWIQPLILFLVMTDLCMDPRSLAYLWLGFLGALFTMAFASIIGVEGLSNVNIGWAGDRMGFSGINLNRQAYWYALGLATLLWIVLERWPRIRKGDILTIAGAVILAMALLRTGSRGGLMVAASGIVVLLSLSLRKRNFSALMSFVPLFALVGLWMASTNEVVVARFGALFEGKDDGARMSIWLPALDLIAEHPWLGIGPGFTDVLGDERGFGRNISSHNSYLQVAISFGIPALLLWITLISSILLCCWHFRNIPIGALLIALVTSSLVNGISSDLGFNKYFWILLAIASRVQVYAAWLDPELRNWNWKTMLGIRRPSGRETLGRNGPLLR